LVSARRNIIKDLRILINCWVDKPYGTLANIQPRSIYERHDTPKSGGAGTSSVDVLEFAVDGDYVVDAVCRDVRETTRRLGRVVLCGGIGRLVFGEVGFDG